jgi:hypothetical protein
LQRSWPVLALAAYYVGERRAPVPVGAFLDTNLMPVVSPQISIRPTVTGPVPGMAEVTYRFSVNYTFGTKDPYLVGPNSSVAPSAAQLVPVEVFRVTAGLACQF